MTNNTIEPDQQEFIYKAIHDLVNTDRLKRQRTRLALIRLGSSAVPGLLEAMSSPNHHLRWETVKLLGKIGGPEAVLALINALEDPEFDVRWAAMDSLILLDCESVEPLLKALTECFGSVWLREGARHVLNVLRQRERLNDAEKRVLDSLKDAAPDVEVPWAAEAALGKNKH
ncbi:MAG: HEAT repeat domain-containing protein [Omnitrophica WOR_2 bacterium]